MEKEYMQSKNETPKKYVAPTMQVFVLEHKTPLLECSPSSPSCEVCEHCDF